MDWNDTRAAQAVITDWANRQFPKRKPEHTLMKLVLDEVGEYYRAPGDPLEFADLLILLYDLASMHGIDIPEALEAKMAINERRQWHFDEKTGLAQHVEERKNSNGAQLEFGFEGTEHSTLANSRDPSGPDYR